MNRGEKWKEGKLKHLAVIRNGQDYKEVVSESGIYPVYGSGGVFAKATDFLYDGKSVLFGRKGTIDKPRLAAGRFWTVDTMFYSEIDRHACPEFVYYVATTIPYSLYSTSTALPSMTQDDLKNHAVLIPSFTEQRQIATYLNRETAKIDKLIVKQQKLIKLLQEKRQAVISQAVTKGLDSNVKMKDSGVEWLGEVPEHWTVGPLKRFILSRPGAIKTGPFGSQLKSEDMNDVEVKVLNQRNVIDQDLNSGDNYVSFAKFCELKSFEIENRDILVTTRGTIGKAVVVENLNERAILHPCLLRIQTDQSRLSEKFLALYLNECDSFRRQITFSSNATTIEVIYSYTMANIVIPLPDIGEQASILDYVSRQIIEYDLGIQKATETNALLKERRQALITAAVTGKIDVRGLVTDGEVAALDAEPELETTEEDFASDVAEDSYITEEE